jgi:hypothetical protein
MPINTIPVTIADFTTLAVTAMTTPVNTGESGLGAFVRGVGSGSERTRGKKRAKLVIARPGGDGAIAVYGAMLPDPLSGKPLGNAFANPGAETVAVKNLGAAIGFGANAVLSPTALLDTGATTAGQPANIAAGVPTNLHIVVANGAILRCSNTPAAGTATTPPEITFTVTAGVITLYVGAAGGWTGGTPAPAGLEVVEYFVAAPSQVLVGAAHLTEYVGIESQDVLFVTATTAVTAGRSLVTLDHVVE